MPAEIVELTSCGNAAEADHLVWLLAENDVRAFVDGANSNTMLNYVGPALGGVRVFVRAVDVERAAKILDSAVAPAADQSEWYCGNCQESVDADFAICWSCGLPREEAEQPLPTADASPRQQFEPDESDNQQPEFAADPDESNPYSSPRANTSVAEAEHEEAEVDERAEAILLRAWRAAILGIVFFPVIMHFYSMCLLIQVSFMSVPFSPRGQRLFYAAFLVNLAAAAAVGALFLLMTNRF